MHLRVSKHAPRGSIFQLPQFSYDAKCVIPRLCLEARECTRKVVGPVDVWHYFRGDNRRPEARAHSSLAPRQPDVTVRMHARRKWTATDVTGTRTR